MISVELKNGFHLKNGEYRIERTLGQVDFDITYGAELVSLGTRWRYRDYADIAY